MRPEEHRRRQQDRERAALAQATRRALPNWPDLVACRTGLPGHVIACICEADRATELDEHAAEWLEHVRRAGVRLSSLRFEYLHWPKLDGTTASPRTEGGPQ
jgi:hypothetical protein